MSNQHLQVVPRELVHPVICGVDFGENLYVLVRSPRRVLWWASGHSWSVNGHTSYAESQLTVMPDRSKSDGAHLKYHAWHRGGRLSCAVLKRYHAGIVEAFDEEVAKAVIGLQLHRETLLVEGGGPPLMPSRKMGFQAYQDWLRLPERGFTYQEGVQGRDRREGR